MKPAGWLIRLNQWAQRRMGDPFEWGQTDCGIVCLEAVDSMRGRFGLAFQYRGTYHSERSAVRLAHRGASLIKWLEDDGVFKYPGEPQPGDILIHPHPHLPFDVGHVCLGEVCLSAHLSGGVACGFTADVMAQPAAGIWRAA